MEELIHVKPSIEYKEQLEKYIEEHEQYNSHMNGTGGLNHYKGHIEEYLKHLEEEENNIPSSTKVPSLTYMLIRKSDNKLIGMINIRLSLNENLMRCGGHIGYGIRPTERRKGYNKINLYLGLKKCQEQNMHLVLLDCVKENIGSSKTMQALGGELVAEYYEENRQAIVNRYVIIVEESIKKYSNIYEEQGRSKKYERNRS